MGAMAARGKREEREEREGEGAAAADETTPQKTRGEAKESAVRPLEDSLDEFVPGIEILDRDLVFEGGARADLAGVDPSGRLHLVVVAGRIPIARCWTRSMP